MFLIPEDARHFRDGPLTFKSYPDMVCTAGSRFNNVPLILATIENKVSLNPSTHSIPKDFSILYLYLVPSLV